MNQLIQIQDGFQYIAADNQLQITAHYGPQQINCYICDVCVGAERFYQQFQFDIEEALTDLLEQQAWNDNGEVFLSASDI